MVLQFLTTSLICGSRSYFVVVISFEKFCKNEAGGCLFKIILAHCDVTSSIVINLQGRRKVSNMGGVHI